MAIKIGSAEYTGAVQNKISVNDFIRRNQAEDVAAFIKAHPQCDKFSPVQMAMAEAGLSKKSRISDFYSTNGNELLFPALVEQQITEAVDENPLLGLIIANTIMVPGKDVRVLKFDFTSADAKKKLEYKEVAEGAELPVVQIAESDKTINIAKYGLAVKSTYESIQDASVERFMLTLTEALRMNAARQRKAAIDVAINGDGNDNAAKSLLTTAASNVISGTDIVNLMVEYMDYTGGLMVDTFVAGKDAYKQLASMYAPSTSQNVYRPGAGFAFPQCNFGNVNVIYDDSVASGKLLAMNRAAAIDKYVVENSVISEFDRDITSQKEIGTLSERAGFGKRNDKATVLLTVKA